MKKITINLYPFQQADEPPLNKTLAHYIPAVILVLILLIIVNIGAFALANIFEMSRASLENTNKNLAPSIKDIQELKDALEAQIKEKKDYQSISTTRIQATRIMAEVYGSMPKNIWLRSFSFDRDTLALEGTVVKWKEEQMASLDKFIKDLNKKDYFVSQFKNANVKDYRKGKVQNTETIDFVIECIH